MDDIFEDDPLDGDAFSFDVEVVLPSGARFHVHEKEVDYFNERASRYLEDNKLTNISDLQDIDRMLIMETLCWRWGNWLSWQKDYWGDAIDIGTYQKQISDTSRELRLIKKALGIDKETRDRQRGEDSVEKYLENLRVRAKEFGYTREKQLDKALELFNELQALIQLHHNCDEVEQRELRCRQEDVITWITEVAMPQYQEIDAYFRENQQRFWVRKV